LSPSLPADLVRVLRWLSAHLSEPIQLEVLAQVAGVRPRTLESHFKLFLGTTPLGWVRRMRLARARQILLRSEPNVTVTDVALTSGFSQLGRFAAQYRQLFGERPSQTMERSRSLLSDDDGNFDEAVRLTLEALPFAFAVAPRQCCTALEKLARPRELAPSYGLPRAVAGWCWAQRAAHRFSSTPELDRARAFQLAEEAYRLAPADALTLTLSVTGMRSPPRHREIRLRYSLA
jgi:AraC-like DNA-binding protein